MAEGIAALPFFPSNSCSALTVKQDVLPLQKKNIHPWKSILVDGWNPAKQLRLVVYPTIERVFLHPRWLFGISSINSMSPQKAISTGKLSSNHYFLRGYFHFQGVRHVTISILCDFFQLTYPHLLLDFLSVPPKKVDDVIKLLPRKSTENLVVVRRSFPLQMAPLWGTW